MNFQQPFPSSHTQFISYQPSPAITSMQNFPSVPLNPYTSNIDAGRYSENRIGYLGSPTYIASVPQNSYLNNFTSSFQSIEQSEFVKRSAAPIYESKANNINFENNANIPPIKKEYALNYEEKNNFLNEQRFNTIIKSQPEKSFISSSGISIKKDFAISNYEEKNNFSIPTVTAQTALTSSSITPSNKNYEEKITNLIREIDELKNDKISLAEKLKNNGFFDEKVEAYEKRISELQTKVNQLEQEQRENRKKNGDSMDLTVDLKTKFNMLQYEFQSTQTENQNMQNLIQELQLKLSGVQNWQMDKRENERKFNMLNGENEQLGSLAKERLDEIELLRNKFIVVEGELREIPILQSKNKDYEIQFNLLNKDIVVLKETIKVS